ncbi:MAG: peptidylprolyl isomerase [Gemmataceae bacterium]|nr:peptidylprolyl isomerase [Gemmataceae bacterium]
MSWLRFFRSKKTAHVNTGPSNRGRRARPQVERLEAREAPANDIFTVTGQTGQQVSMHFEWLQRRSQLWNEIGVFTVDDTQGRVDDLLPGDAGYVEAAMSRAQLVFRAGDFEGAESDLSFTAGTQLAFYLVQNNTLENVLQTNPLNRPIPHRQVFFSIDVANRDRFDHLHTRTFGDRSLRLFWEDVYGGGDRDFNDAIIHMSYNTQDTALAIGVDGQFVRTRFKKLRADTPFRNEVGFFEVDDATGSIDGLDPGDEGYAQAAIERSVRVFARRSPVGAVRNRFLSGGGFFGFYLIQHGTALSFLRFNPGNSLQSRGPLAYFSFDAANPDGAEHFRWLSNTRFAFEDGRNGGDKDFNDFVGTINMIKPGNSGPFVAAPIANRTVTETASNDQSIDLAGVFRDVDFGNSLVRIATNKGTFDLELFDRDAPRTVTNFLNYVTDGDYANAIFHRRANSPFVLQGGGFMYVNNGGNTSLPGIAADPSVANERDATNRPNVRGTIAMAKSTADNATNQFYFNIGNNSVGDAVNLDDANNTGGFTVFGRVVEGDMSLLDQLAAIPTSPRGGVFDEIPLDNFTGATFPDDLERDDLIVINSITVLRRPEFLTFAVAGNSNPSIVNVSLVHNHVVLDYLAAGTSTITLSATDKVGHVATTSFTVTVTDDDTAPPVITLTGSEGTQTDADNQTFSWDVTDAGSGVASTTVSITRDNVEIHSATTATGSFDFNSFGTGVYVMTVNATDADNESPGDALSSMATRMVTVTDDDVDPPLVTLGGSQGNEMEADDQNFTWDVVDAGSGVGSVSVSVTKDNVEIFTSSLTSGSFDFNSEGVGVFVITVDATDADADSAGDAASSNGNTRTVTVT